MVDAIGAFRALSVEDLYRLQKKEALEPVIPGMEIKAPEIIESDSAVEETYALDKVPAGNEYTTAPSFAENALIGTQLDYFA